MYAIRSYYGWLKQPGFPLVDIKQNGTNLKISQNRYLLEPEKKFATGKWVIPLSIKAGEQITSKLFSQKSMSIKIPKSIGFVANYGRKGFYRVKYDEGTLLSYNFV